MKIKANILKALAEGDLDELKQFFQEDPSVVNSVLDEEGNSLLHLAARHGFTEVVHFLLDHGADIGALNKDHQTPLGYAIYFKYSIETIELLINKGADINKSHNGWPAALHRACWLGVFDLVNILLQKGADIDLRCASFSSMDDTPGDLVTPLHLAALAGKADIVSLLIAYKAKVNAKSESGSTPLYKALVGSTNTKAVVLRLLAGGADYNIGNQYGRTPIDIARAKGYTKIVEIFRIMPVKTEDVLEAESANNDIFEAIRAGNINNAVGLIFTIPGVIHSEKAGNRPIHVAAQNAQPEIMGLLLKHGVDINVQNQEGNTALHLAVMHLHEVRRLIGISDQQASRTLLECLKYNPNLDILNNEGASAWDVAFGCDEEQICFWIDEAERLQKANQSKIANITYTLTKKRKVLEVQDVQAYDQYGAEVVLNSNEISLYSDYFLNRRNWSGGLGTVDSSRAGKLVWNVQRRQISPNKAILASEKTASQPDS